MRRLPFIKMHGAGNDYVFLDGFHVPLPEDPAALAAQMSCRHFGVGSDGLIVLVPPTRQDCDVEMRMWNANGSVGSMCGNGARCVALWMALEHSQDHVCRVETSARVVTATTQFLNRTEQQGLFSVDMGCPEFENGSTGTLEYLNNVVPVNDAADDGFQIALTAVSMGNPHAVIFCEQLTDHAVLGLGPAIENHQRFPQGTNVEWVRVVSDTELESRVWERGSGETMACGSGACAAAVVAVQRGFCRRDVPIRVNLPGGQLEVCWCEDGRVLLSGPAAVSFLGEWPVKALTD